MASGKRLGGRTCNFGDDHRDSLEGTGWLDAASGRERDSAWRHVVDLFHDRPLLAPVCCCGCGDEGDADVSSSHSLHKRTAADFEGCTQWDLGSAECLRDVVIQRIVLEGEYEFGLCKVSQVDRSLARKRMVG